MSDVCSKSWYNWVTVLGTFTLANTYQLSEGLTVCTHLGNELRIMQLLESSFVNIPRTLENCETISLPKNSSTLKTPAKEQTAGIIFFLNRWENPTMGRGQRTAHNPTKKCVTAQRCQVLLPPPSRLPHLNLCGFDPLKSRSIPSLLVEFPFHL